MNTKEKFIEIFSANDILKIHKNSKLSKELIINAFILSYDNNIPLQSTLKYSSRKALSTGLRRAILIDKPSGLHWPKYLLDKYYPARNWNKTGINVSATENRKEYDRQYALFNKGKKNSTTAKRKASKKHRTPIWSEEQEIRVFYTNCPTGFHVDHIVPLQGELVSGLHVLNNLQYLTHTENLKKSNKFKIE